MKSLEQHPTVVSFRRKRPAAERAEAAPLDGDWLRRTCLECGADDVGFVSIDRPELDGERPHILEVFPRARTLVSFVCRMNREPIRSPARSAANVEFHRSGDHVNDVAHRIVAALEARGVRAMNPAMGFPMEVDAFPGRIWVISHKPVAVAAGLGRMGLHRNVIHPVFGNFILLGTIAVEAAVSAEGRPLDYNPCLDCKLCVAACPVGAISAEGAFNAIACYTHNYREFMGGFSDWVETVVESRSVSEYRERVSLGETVSMWQSLSFGANYKAAYCMAVCPAGEDVIGPFLEDRKGFLADVVRPLQDKVETVYVAAGSEAAASVARRFPHKRIKHVRNGLRLTSVAAFLEGLPRTFQPKRAEGLEATYHFTFTGAEELQATVVIRDGAIRVAAGHQGEADLRVTADAATWLAFLNKERGLVMAMLRRKIRLKGSAGLLPKFGKCFAL